MRSRVHHSSLTEKNGHPEAERRVAVIGAGFSGTMVAIHLHAVLPAGCQIVLCERDRFARGAAYATPFATHMLNVRATGMSAFAADPHHFVNWLGARATGRAGEVMTTAAGSFASRRLYGEYVSELLYGARVAAGERRMSLRLAEVVDIERAGPGFRLRFLDGSSERVGAAVLAMGNLPPPPTGSPVHLTNPWEPGVTKGLRPDLPVLIVGTGLTMIDLVTEMRDTGFAAPIIALSRRGLLPQRHRATEPWPTPAPSAAERGSLLALLRHIRGDVRKAAASGVDWRSVIDSLRPITSDLWCGLPLRERARFMRHLRPYWDAHRHRLAEPIAERIDAMRAQGQLDIRRGRLLDVRVRDAAAEATCQLFGTPEPTCFTVQRLIDATGLAKLSGSENPLVNALLRRGLVRIDALGLGLEVTPSLETIDASGHATRSLCALGPLVRGALWECTAVPEIRVHAERVARAVAALFRPQTCASWVARSR
jgi:uncharacterized NAD(P)/FAD-binding protein YdhS